MKIKLFLTLAATCIIATTAHAQPGYRTPAYYSLKHPEWAPLPAAPPGIATITNQDGMTIFLDDFNVIYPHDNDPVITNRTPQIRAVITNLPPINWYINTNHILDNPRAEWILRKKIIKEGQSLMSQAHDLSQSNRIYNFTNDQIKLLDTIRDKRIAPKTPSGGGDIDDPPWVQSPYISAMHGNISGTNCPGNEPHHNGHGFGSGQCRSTAGNIECLDELGDPLTWDSWTNTCRLTSEYSYPSFRFPDICGFDISYSQEWPALLCHFDGTWAFSHTSFSTNYWFKMGMGSGTNYGHGLVAYSLELHCHGTEVLGTEHLYVTATILSASGMAHPEEIPEPFPYDPPPWPYPSLPPKYPSINPLTGALNAFKVSIITSPNTTINISRSATATGTNWTAAGAFTTDSVNGYGETSITNTNPISFYRSTITNVW